MRIPPIDPKQSPLSAAQVAQFNAFASSLNPEQTPWLLGYLVGVQQLPGGGAPALPASPGSNGSSQLTVLFASQTGNAARVAKQLVAAAGAAGIHAVAVSTADLPAAKLRDVHHLALVISTQGEGDPPDSAVELKRALFGKRAPRLEGTRFAVLALGDESYTHFCKAGADFDQRFEELGAQRVVARVDCDVDYQVPAQSWQEQVIAAFKSIGHASGAAPAVAPVAAASVATETAPSYDKDHPFPAAVLERTNLNGRGSAKRTLHFELSLTGSGITYLPGDAIGVVPRNAPGYVRELLVAARLPGEAMVTVDGREQDLYTALSETFEITTITRSFLKAYVAETKHDELARLVEKGQEEGFRAYVDGREIIDVLLTYPRGAMSAQGFVGMLRRLQPRLYSIASSLQAHEEEVHLLVGLTRYDSHGRTREGVCSGYLCERLGEDEPVRVYPSPNPSFRLPDNPDARIIMIGPGTGVAPFRAFVEERSALGSRGRNWLFFGDQHFGTDFLYQVEWQRWHKSGVLSRLDLAFSRDQPQKIYVQHRMQEHGRDLYAWLQDGAHVYVCGDASQMAASVHETLLGIVAKESGKGVEAAEEYVESLRSNKRYQRDVY
jgi:sulfite reductase (NADPH) flavoprotein alpha-component